MHIQTKCQTYIHNSPPAGNTSRHTDLQTGSGSHNIHKYSDRDIKNHTGTPANIQTHTQAIIQTWEAGGGRVHIYIHNGGHACASAATYRDIYAGRQA